MSQETECSDVAAVVGWHTEFGDPLRAFAAGLLRDATAADDVVQTTFAKALQQQPIPSNPRAWLFTVARNECLTVLRRRTREKRAIGELEARKAESEVATVECSHPAIESLLAELSSADVDLLRRRIVDGASYRELSDETGENPSTLTTRVQRLLKRLRRAGSQRDAENP